MTCWPFWPAISPSRRSAARRRSRPHGELISALKKADLIGRLRRAPFAVMAGSAVGTLAREALLERVHQVQHLRLLFLLGHGDLVAMDLGVDQLLELIAVAVLVSREVKVVAVPVSDERLSQMDFFCLGLGQLVAGEHVSRAT